MRPRLSKAAALLLGVSLVLGSGVPAGAWSSTGRERTDLDAVDQRVQLRSEAVGEQLSSLKASSSLVIVRFAGPVEERWKEAVDELGVKLGDYLPEFSFIAKVPDSRIRKRLESLPFVKEVRPFYPAYKLAPDLLRKLHDGRDLQVAVVGFDREQPVDRTVRRVIPGARTSHSHSSQSPRVTELSVDSDGVKRLLESDDVVAVLPVPERKTHNDVAAKITQSDALASAGYTGRNQIIGVADTGLDTGNPATLHKDLQGRVLKLIPVGRPGDASDRDGHGTHVAGSIVGTGKASRGKYKGLAPDAKLVFHAMADQNGDLKGDLYQMWAEAYEQGARIHSDSWGSNDFGGYSYDSLMADQFLWEHKDMTALIAAGNLGEWGESTVGSPATAKNVIAVGASESVRPIGGALADDPNEVASFSSRGPTLDGRIKPDIVAPGTFIVSTRSSLAAADHFDAVMNRYYAYMSGTSMATPVLAGGVAQIRQYLQDHGHDDPSAALIKAMLLTGAQDLGVNMFEQGFGRADLKAAIAADALDEQDGLQTRESASYTVQASDPDKPFVVTLAWTDYPASPLAFKALVNDLNLIVTSPSGRVYNGNDFRAPYDDRTDRLNNVEQVYITDPEPGTYTVTVVGYNIPCGPQPYALATTGTWQGKVKERMFVDPQSVSASVKLFGSRYQVSVKGKLLDEGVDRILVRVGENGYAARVRNGSFSLGRTVSVGGRYVEDVSIEVTGKDGERQSLTIPVEKDLIKDGSLTADETDQPDGKWIEVSGQWTGAAAASAFVSAGGNTYPLAVTEDGFSGRFPPEGSEDAVVVAVDRSGNYEVEQLSN